MECVGVALLTSSNLNLPEFQEKDAGRTEAFVRSQRTLATVFDVGAPPLQEQESARISPEDKVRSESGKFKTLEGGGFSSPALRARVDRMPSLIPTKHKHLKTPRDGTNKRKHADSTFVDQRKATANSRATKKRPASPDSERAVRLTDRRERKRANRAIMNPAPILPEPGGEGSSESDHRSKRAKKSGSKDKPRKKKKSKIDAALTLMQNFTATNIGKDRLTLRPGPNMGFFNKGKASASMKTCSKKGKKKDLTFSELRFLNNTPYPFAQSETDAPTSTCSSSRRQEAPQPKLSKFFIADSRHNNTKHKSRRQEEHSKILHSPKKTLTNCSEVNKSDFSDDARKSDVWDIELDKPLPSEDGSTRHSNPEAVLVLNTKSMRWGLRELDPPPAMEKQEDSLSQPSRCLSLCPLTVSGQPYSDIMRRGTRSPSLAPSNSASQQAPVTLSVIPSNIVVQPAQTFKYPRSPGPSDRGHQFSVSYGHPPFRFRPTHRFKTYEYPISPAPESLLFPPCSEHDEREESLSQNIIQEEQDISSHYIEDFHSILLGEDQMGSEVLDCIDVQAHSLTRSDRHEASGSGKCLDESFWHNAVVNDGILSDQHSVQRKGDTKHPNDEISEYQLYEWGEEMASPYMTKLDGQLLSSNESMVDGDNLSTTSVDELERRLASPAFCTLRNLDTESSFPFTQGRSLLLGVEDPISGGATKYLEGGLEHAQVEVAQRLKDHWVPQKL